jgi:hypothetical protein
MGQFVVQSPACKVHFLPFRAIHNFEREHPLLALKVYQLASMVLADGYDRCFLLPTANPNLFCIDTNLIILVDFRFNLVLSIPFFLFWHLFITFRVVFV